MADITRNLLLQALPPESLERLMPHISESSLDMAEELYAPGDVMASVYFPIDGVVSVTTSVDGGEGEVATVGYEGFVGLPVLFGVQTAQMRTFMQIGGSLATVSSAVFAAALRDDEALSSLMLRYAQAIFFQVAQSVVCNQRHTLRQRSARWLLTTHDRVRGDDFHLTHEFLAQMLGVRRAGVTVAAGELQEAGHITYRRGTVRILDRLGLERVSCECYELVREAYERIIGLTVRNASLTAR